VVSKGNLKKDLFLVKKIMKEEQKPKFPLPTIEDQKAGAKRLESTDETSGEPFSCGKNEVCAPSGEYSPYMDKRI